MNKYLWLSSWLLASWCGTSFYPSNVLAQESLSGSDSLDGFNRANDAVQQQIYERIEEQLEQEKQNTEETTEENPPVTSKLEAEPEEMVTPDGTLIKPEATENPSVPEM